MQSIDMWISVKNQYYLFFTKGNSDIIVVWILDVIHIMQQNY